MAEIPHLEQFPDVRAWVRAIPVSTTAPPPGPEASPRPQDLFLRWLTDAVDAGLGEPHAATLSTVDEDGWPDARVLLLKDVTAEGWWFSGDDRSPKGRHLGTTPAAALTFYWREHGRQVRLRGAVHSGDREVCARDFVERSTLARAVASTGRQSAVLDDPGDYDRLVQDRLDTLEADPGWVSPHWTAWCVEPVTVEFWQADPGRRHRRLRYRRDDSGWTREQLFP
ncbi:pyridoxine/pyridoxamine 5'-phosphate oxidase [Rhodococcus coprophilus]|uniref:pyridoxine/pyridoxamine 5'-phosphate oxidase n=1 Tax=Rhodococcus coprophilus TaxID=38310 RepID=UPI00340B1EC3